MQQIELKVIDDFSDFILDRRDEIAERWCNAVYSDMEINSTNNITRAQLIHPITKIVEEIPELLKQPLDEVIIARARQNSLTHGRDRFRQGFALDELMRELGILRVILLDYITDFHGQNPDLTVDSTREARKQIHRMLNDVFIFSVKQFSEEQAFEAQCYREKLEAANLQLEKTISELRRLERDLKQKAEEAINADRAKDEIISIVSHELRTPLNAALGWARLLRSGKLNQAAVERAIGIIERNIRTQERLVNDLLDVGRIITGKMTLDIKKVELTSIIESSLEIVGPIAEEKKIRPAIIIGQMGKPISGDPYRLQQVVMNLLTNAVKFTPDGGRVYIILTYTDSSAKIIVEDTGKGISEDFLPYIFDRFRQADNTSSQRQNGLGLGLPIVRHIVELHGGRVQAESKGEGQGAIFTVDLPLMNEL